MTETKQSYTVKEFAAKLGIGRESARLLLKKEPGVIRFEGRGAGVRHHLRVPLAVVERLVRRMTDR